MKSNFEFRAGTCDANVFRSVVELNEYQLPEKLASDGLILDVGAHIGSFTQACLDRGARRIMAFEPDRENFQRLCRHLSFEIAEGWVTPVCAAVTGSGGAFRRLSKYLVTPDEVNTGGASVTHAHATMDGSLVVNLMIDAVLAHISDEIALLKLDCEGSEWGILKRLAERPDVSLASVCGEYHPFPGFPLERLDQLMKAMCFCNLNTVPHGDSGLGLFWADKEITRALTSAATSTQL